ncbi:hypothetical protein [Rhizosphaericola mali]|uniref:DUF4230 domain-containing protein n=1 Tax=Rhizosphaericola mali TaxID=2545455 RepID=A0A5P2GBE4_9BACT|nr:hypothetical protein [Rhizosphaericola mali]QES88881.1 hypothetical protein E0W69_009505 [Rhizosphaericola mali]
MKNKNLWISLGLILCIASCMSLQKATKKVLDSKSATDKVGRVWAIDNPCTNDTTLVNLVTPVLVPGKDSIVNGKDSIVINVQHDTVYVTTYKPIYYHKTDTIYLNRTAYVTDKRALNIAQDSANYYKQLSELQAAQIKGLNTSLSDQNKLLKSAKIALWAVIIIALGIIFRKPLFSFIGKFL